MRAVAVLFAFGLALPLGLFVATPGRAQADAGPDPCDPRCDGDVLRFCDADAPAELDCRALNGRCGLLSDAWGEDCLLGAAQACDPGYAFGLSRCDAAASLFCIDGACAEGDGPPAEAVEEPTRGTEIDLNTASTNPFGCTDCGTGQSALLLPTLLVLRLRRKNRAGGR